MCKIEAFTFRVESLTQNYFASVINYGISNLPCCVCEVAYRFRANTLYKRHNSIQCRDRRESRRIWWVRQTWLLRFKTQLLTAWRGHFL